MMHFELQNYWRNQRLWPPEPPGMVFLVRAVQMIGTQRYGDAWTGAEAWADRALIPSPLPADQEKASPEQLRQAHELTSLKPTREDALPKAPILPPPKVALRLDDSEWEAARRHSLKLAESAAGAVARWEDVLMITHQL